MAGSSCSWHKVQRGPLAGCRVFVPAALREELDPQGVQEQLDAAQGALFAAVRSARLPGVRVKPPPWEPEGRVWAGDSPERMERLDRVLQRAYRAGAGFASQRYVGQAPLKSLTEYQSMAYVEINGWLWGDPEITGDPKAVAYARRHVRQLDALFRHARLPLDALAARVNSSDSGLYELARRLDVGQLYVAPGFDSASLWLDHEWGDSKVRLFYRLPRGTRALYLNGIGASPTAHDFQSGAYDEYECLLDRGSRWRVVGKEIGPNEEISLTVELVEQQGQVPGR